MRPQVAKSDAVYVALKNRKIIAALRLCTHEDAWLLRSMCVGRDDRNSGVGSYMLSALQDILAEKPCYCFPFEHLEGFYKRAGFGDTNVEEIPVIIADKYRKYSDQGRKILLMKFG